MYNHVWSRLVRTALFAHAGLLAAGVALSVAPLSASANPPGWSTAIPITVTEGSGTDLADYQARLVIDTASIIAAGDMAPNGDDLRFATDFDGTSTIPYWIESGINTASTVVWIKVPLLAASSNTGIWLFSGNPVATTESTLDVFDFTGLAENSATNQVLSGAPGGVGNSQRGFRFSPNEDILVTQFGKAEPTGTTRYITLFDFATQAVLAQAQVSGPAAQYTYADLPQPIWLNPSQQYLLEIYQDASDGYYFGNSSQINSRLTYYDMRYCNSCTKDSFPTNTLTNFHYGYADFEFRTRQHAGVEPVATPGAGPTQTLLQSDSASPVLGTTVTFTATVDGIFAPGGSVDFTSDGSPIAGCTGVALNTDVPPLATCATSALTAGDHAIVATYAGDANNAASTSDSLTQTVTRLASSTTLGTACRTTFVEGQPITFQSNTTSSQSPTGTVTFDKGGASMCADVPLIAGLATCSVTDLAVVGGGPLSVYDISAIYAGDSDNLPSTSAILPVTVLSATEVLLRDGFDLGDAGCPAH